MLRKVIGFPTKRNDASAFGELGITVERKDTLLLPYTTTKRTGLETVNPQQLLYLSLHDPIAYRITFKCSEDAINPWFTIVTQDNKPHDDNAKIQELLQEKDAKKVLRQVCIGHEIFGRSFLTKFKKKWVAINPLDLDTPKADAYDENGEFQTIQVRYQFQQLRAKTKASDLTPVEPKKYIMLNTRPRGLTSLGTSLVEVCYDDLHYLYNIRRDMAERMRKYAGFIHVKIDGGTESLISAYKAKYGNLNKLDEVWSNKKLEMEMKGMEGTALSPDDYYKPFIEQISIATGIPSPILRGMESGQLKSGQVNLSSYYSVITNIQSGATAVAEWMVDDVKPGTMKEAKIRWNMEFASSEIDREAINEIRASNAVTLQPYISDDAFAKMLLPLGITEKDILTQEQRNANNPMFGEGNDFGEGGSEDGDKPNSPFEGKMNPVKEEKGREINLKKNPKVRSNT